MDLKYFSAVSVDGKEIILASENETTALDSARLQLDRWNVKVTSADATQVILFNACLKMSATIH